MIYRIVYGKLGEHVGPMPKDGAVGEREHEKGSAEGWMCVECEG
jgi:hypothetical protein